MAPILDFLYMTNSHFEKGEDMGSSKFYFAILIGALLLSGSIIRAPIESGIYVTASESDDDDEENKAKTEYIKSDSEDIKKLCGFETATTKARARLKRVTDKDGEVKAEILECDVCRNVRKSEYEDELIDVTDIEDFNQFLIDEVEICNYIPFKPSKDECTKPYKGVEELECKVDEFLVWANAGERDGSDSKQRRLVKDGYKKFIYKDLKRYLERMGSKVGIWDGESGDADSALEAAERLLSELDEDIGEDVKKEITTLLEGTVRKQAIKGQQTLMQADKTAETNPTMAYALQAQAYQQLNSAYASYGMIHNQIGPSVWGQSDYWIYGNGFYTPMWSLFQQLQMNPYDPIPAMTPHFGIGTLDFSNSNRLGRGTILGTSPYGTTGTSSLLQLGQQSNLLEYPYQTGVSRPGIGNPLHSPVSGQSVLPQSTPINNNNGRYQNSPFLQRLQGIQGRQ